MILPTLLLALFVAANAGAIEATEANFDEVISGKNAFVKFFCPMVWTL